MFPSLSIHISLRLSVSLSPPHSLSICQFISLSFALTVPVFFIFFNLFEYLPAYWSIYWFINLCICPAPSYAVEAPPFLCGISAPCLPPPSSHWAGVRGKPCSTRIWWERIHVALISADPEEPKEPQVLTIRVFFFFFKREHSAHLIMTVPKGLHCRPNITWDDARSVTATW